MKTSTDIQDSQEYRMRCIQQDGIHGSSRNSVISVIL